MKYKLLTEKWKRWLKEQEDEDYFDQEEDAASKYGTVNPFVDNSDYSTEEYDPQIFEDVPYNEVGFRSWPMPAPPKHIIIHESTVPKSSSSFSALF